jgi:hypothetical protein
MRLALIDADRLPGQPEATGDMLDRALDGRSPVDSGWWSELDPPRADVVRDPAGRVWGVVSYAFRPGDGAGIILWLHAEEEDQAVAEALVGHALDQIGQRTVHAFEFASALTLLAGTARHGSPPGSAAASSAGTPARNGRMRERRCRASTPAAATIATNLMRRGERPGWVAAGQEVCHGVRLPAVATRSEQVAGLARCL